MHPLLAALTGKPAIKNWRDHVAAAQKKTVKIEAFMHRANNHQAEIAAAAAAFAEAPTEILFQKWVLLDGQKDAMFRLGQTLRDVCATQRETALGDGGAAKLIAACDEAEAELDARAQRTRADDARRAEESGVDSESTGVFRVIDGMKEKLAQARAYAVHDLRRSASMLDTVLGGT